MFGLFLFIIFVNVSQSVKADQGLQGKVKVIKNQRAPF